MAAEQAVYVVDDEQDICNLLRDFLATAGLSVKTFTSGKEFLATYDQDRPGCLLLDISMPGMSGLEVLEELKSRGCMTPVIFLTGSGNVSTAVEALKGGAIDFIEKPPRLEALLNCVRNALSVDLQGRYERMQRLDIEHRIELLTPRETEVMRWLVEGKSNKMIARILDISSRTVEIHRKNIIDKMQANSVADLVKMNLSVQV